MYTALAPHRDYRTTTGTIPPRGRALLARDELLDPGRKNRERSDFGASPEAVALTTGCGGRGEKVPPLTLPSPPPPSPGVRSV